MAYVNNVKMVVRVYELGSMSAAARDQRTSPAVASARVSELEKHLGVRLFNRTTRSLKPTESGRLFYDGARRVLEAIEEAEAAVVDVTQSPRGTLFVAAPLGLGRRLVAPLIPAFKTEYPRIDLRLLDWPRHRSLRNLVLLAQLGRIIAAERPSVIHLMSNNTIWLNLAAPFWHRRPVVTTVHDVEAHPGDRETRGLPDWPSRLMVRQSDHIIVHGAGLKQQAQTRFAKADGQVHVLPHPAITRYARLAEAKRLSPRPQTGSFRLLLFGRIYAYKGLEHLIRAEAILRDRLPGLQLTIAGRGDDPRSLSHLMGDPARYEILHRFIEDAEVAQLFLDADLIVLPYSEASQSGVLMLAAAFGKAVVATDVGEIGESVTGSGSGLVVPAANPGALADAIETMARQPRLRAQCAARARDWAQGAIAPATVGAEAVEIYRRIAPPEGR
ncbi:glycosyltransferase [Thioclava sp. BHET1]|nr:glycosyltransferase [Thioclava sp. BHET1]